MGREYRFAPFEECIRPNLALMGISSRLIPCINNECTFRGTQKDMWIHLKECPHEVLDCEICGAFNVKRSNHTIDVCSGYIQCSECDEYILKSEKSKHMRINHNLWFCSWCASHVPNNNNHSFTRHRMRECLHRSQLVKCMFCDVCCPLKELQLHFKRHLDYLTSIKEMQSLPLEWDCVSKHNKITHKSIVPRINILFKCSVSFK